MEWVPLWWVRSGSGSLWPFPAGLGGILFRLGLMDGVITVGSSGGAGLVGIWAGVGSGSGVGVAHGSRPGSYGSATGVAGGGAFLVQVAGRGLGDLGLGREGERR